MKKGKKSYKKDDKKMYTGKMSGKKKKAKKGGKR